LPIVAIGIVLLDSKSLMTRKVGEDITGKAYSLSPRLTLHRQIDIHYGIEQCETVTSNIMVAY
jgi:hypothetical protein